LPRGHEAGFAARGSQVGIEMIVQSFGTTWKMEDNGTLYMAAMKREIAYARSKNVEIGGYDLIDLDRDMDGMSPDGSKRNPYDEEIIGMDGKIGGSACFASKWLDFLDPLIEQKITDTGLSMIETDGPYGGGICNSHNHTHHRGLLDSQYWQMRLQSGAPPRDSDPPGSCSWGPRNVHGYKSL
jgi:hypothetical protein